MSSELLPFRIFSVAPWKQSAQKDPHRDWKFIFICVQSEIELLSIQVNGMEKESFVSVPRIHNVYQTSCALWRTWVILRVPLRERMEEFCRSAKCVSPLQIRLADKAQWVWIAPSIIRFVGRDWKFILLISSCVAEFTTQFSNLIPSDSCFLVQIFSRVLHNAWRELKIRLKCKTTARHKLRKFYHIFWQHQQFIFTFLPPSAFYTAYESVKSFTDCIAKAF